MQKPWLTWPNWVGEYVRGRSREHELPLRTELFTIDQLTRHAKALATNVTVDRREQSNRLLSELDANEQVLRAFNRVTLTVTPSRRVTPAAEWLLDNFYLIEEQIQLARRHLPKGYSRELPRLVRGASAGLPRVYDMALELITHTDAQIDAPPLNAFVAAYQTVSPLKLGELWAIPIMLRLGLIENLQRIATRLATAREDRDLADHWVDRLQEVAEKTPSQLVVVVADMAQADLPVTSAFVAEFCQRLARHSPVLHLARNWLEQRLGEHGLSIEHLIQLESQSQAADQVSVSHSIASLRLLSALDWKEFVEGQSRVEATLRTDPAGVYARMDFATRDRYRHAIEFLSRHGKLPETEVAERAIQLAAERARQGGNEDRGAHVGFFLIEKGRPQLERAVRARPPLRDLAERGIHRWPLTFYAGGIALLTVLATAGVAREVYLLDLRGWKLVAFTACFLLCASQLAVAVMNWLSMLLVKPRLLPRLDFSEGIPADQRTLVAVPTMLTSAEGVDRLVETLEIHYLANRDPNLYFALLTDFRDAPAEHQPGDRALLQRARAGVEDLNRRYAASGASRFFLLHRPRRWNPAENLWMGYERKRGKLAEFNALLRGAAPDRFAEIVGDIALLRGVKYVITLDTDTQLPRDAARQLVGTMAHRLNRPQLDARTGIVSEGYGILQPRVGVSLPSAHRSWFSRLFAGDAGIDPYTRAVSDVYQDVFQEGSFIGKGIYDVEAFERALAGRFPENAILSHDLLESSHARSALVSDVELFEEHPSRYNVDSGRRHRWIRGDWQITQWLLPRVPGADVRRMKNPLSHLSQWKIFDNLRRSLVPVALLLLIIGSWWLVPGCGCVGVMLVIGVIAIPAFLSIFVSGVRKPDDLPWGMHLRALGAAVARQFGQIFLTLAFLPYDAFVSLDAIGRTLLRVWITHRRMLEWQTSSDAERTARTDLAGFYATMWIAPTLALVSGGAMALWQPGEVGLALPLLGLWLAAPAIAWRISLSIEVVVPHFSHEQLKFLHRISRKTWAFFEDFVTARENWLPPDNFQETPSPTIASRTSPTNLGLALLANVAARDFGYLSLGGLIQRTRDAFATMGKLERYRGHFYNWYDTQTAKPLQPLYVSSVDSGNLSGHLLVLGAGLREVADEKVFTPQVWLGLRDTAQVAAVHFPGHAALAGLEAELAAGPSTLRAAGELLKRVLARADQLVAAAGETAGPAKTWANKLRDDCAGHRDELLFLTPWLVAAEDPDIPTLRGLFAELDTPATLRQIGKRDQSIVPALLAALSGASSDEGKAIADLASRVREAGDRARQRLADLETLAKQADDFAAVDFTFLYNRNRELFSIGYNVAENRADPSYYDLLASEARLCSYVAIALGQVPQDHWFSLGRLLVASNGEPLLVSWSGSMFEYLMPALVMPNYDRTLLEHTCQTAVKHQIAYADLHGVPWGISESGYNRTDSHLNYQYRAFGVPGLGLKRGLAEDLVIAPYATMMALMISPQEACANLERLAKDGREGAYGFYEAIDYTPSRMPPNETSVTIESFMVHHQGMGFLALDNVLRGDPMPRRFLACPVLKAADLLLQERLPRTAASVFTEDVAMEAEETLAGEAENTMRVITNPRQPAPEVHLLSNGRYHVVISSAGGGYSRWRDLAVTRWREDATRDCWGLFLYLRDVGTGEFWSAAHQPTLRDVKGYEAIFTQARAEFRQRHANLEIHTELCVSPEDDVELRRVTLTNRSSSAKVLELTSYAEVLLTTPGADAAHPAFSNLFVQTEFVPNASAVLCTRRARAADEHPPWLLHQMTVEGGEAGEISCETDRSKFIGRGRSPASPVALQRAGALANTVGSVLDPIIALRRNVTVPAHGKVVVSFVTGMAEQRAGAVAQVEKYQSARMAERAFDLAWTHSQVALRQLNATESEAQLYGRLASALIYADPARRANANVLRNNRRGQSGLWSYGISGDLPIVVVRIGDAGKIDLIRQLIQAHAYWRLKGLAVDLVILNEDASVYRQSLHDEILGLVASGIEAPLLDKPAGIFVRRLEQIPHEDRVLLHSVARVVLEDEQGTLAQQLEQRSQLEPKVPLLGSLRTPAFDPPVALEPRELIFQNGYGGFTRDGHEYVITLQDRQSTPAPWVNVLANPSFGTVVSESGPGYTWVENAHEFRLTPWSNDPVQDTPGEALYIRDEHTGQFWSPTPLPARGTAPYVIRHGFGYTVYEHTENGIASELWVYVAMDAPVKFSVLKLRNVSGRARRLSVTGYWEWVLGDLRAKSLMHVQTEVDVKTGALLAKNNYNTEFPGRITFVDVNDGARTVTGDRKEFLGRNGTLAQPAAMKFARLSGTVGAGLDPCGAMQLAFDLEEGQERETTFRLGVGRNPADVQALLQRYRAPDACRGALEGVWAYWNRTLGAVNVDTPDPAVNVMANGWLLYQTLSCRLWGRTGFYQSGGAYGFRDQLQDVMALVHAEPALTREQLLRAAAHQFKEGDVQHWWHPPQDRGVRTHFSDDYLWLPYVTCRYVLCVADTGVLDEKISFLEGRPVKAEEEAYYDLPNRSDQAATLYEHCVRAIENGLKFGAHGLPLMGCGDWNDGMNKVGDKGRGESVWLAFFLHHVLTQFSILAQARNDLTFAARCIQQAEQLQKNIEEHAWDGKWYRRAYFDDGQPLGSKESPECQIDSLPQSWAVISGAGESERTKQAMESVERHLVRRNARLIQLFDPPFDKSALYPGYIKGYIPGVRENGGQYTHGAIWTTMAFALMGEGERAWEFFNLLNPVNHGATAKQIATYKVEPYVVAADVYAMAPHTGRGGWTWYTGSAGWMYRLLIETLLGANLEGEHLRLKPSFSGKWPSYKIHYRYRQTTYHITITRLAADSAEANSLRLDGQVIEGNLLPLKDDRREHHVEFKTKAV